jgi:integrase
MQLRCALAARRGARGASRVCLHMGEPEGQRNRVGHFRNSRWIQARRRAAARYVQELGKEAPAGFKNVRVHNLRHTFGRRLRAAGVSFEDRQDLLGHRSTPVTTDYNAAELRNLLNAANRLKKSRNDRFAPDGVSLSAVKWSI